jgi:adenylate cyclase
MSDALQPEQLAKLAGISPEELEAYRERGLIDPDGDGRLDELDALRLRLLLHYIGIGRSLDELTDQVKSGSDSVLYGGLLWGDGTDVLTADEAAEEVGLEPEVVEQLLRGLGLGATLPRSDLKFLEAAKALVDAGIPLQPVLDVARVYGDTMRRLAQSEVRMVRQIADAERSSVLKSRAQSQRLEAVQSQLGPILEPMILAVHRRHLLRASLEEVVADLEAAERGSDRETLEAAIAFVDLASFTSLAQVHGDEVAAETLDRFDALVRALADEHSGSTAKQIGDAFMLVFSEPSRALRFAIALDDAATRQPYFPAVRTGINYGPVLFRVGDYVGNTVNVAARIAAMAGANEILMTTSVAEAAEQALVDVVPIGEHELLGVTDPVELWRVARRMAGDVERDPVCGMAAGEEAVARMRYGGVDYAFCSQACLRRFLENPSRYAGRSKKPEL